MLHYDGIRFYMCANRSKKSIDMGSFLAQLQYIIQQSKHNVGFVFTILLALCAVHFLNVLCRYRLNVLGIYPRTVHGLLGIVFSPLLHGSTEHLFFNSIPLVVLSSLVLVYGHYVFWFVTAVVVLLSGFAVWMIGRKAFHIGASNLVLGYMGFVLAVGYWQHSVMTVIVAVLSLYYFGGLLFSLVSAKQGVSWEGHFTGFLAGIGSSYYLLHIA